MQETQLTNNEDEIIDSNGKRRTKEEMILIINELVDMKTSCLFTSHDLIRHIKTKYDYEQAMAYRLLERANKLIAEIYAADTKNLLEKRINELDEVRKMALRSGDRKLWKELSIEISKLEGLYIERSETKHTVINIKVDDEDSTTETE